MSKHLKITKKELEKLMDVVDTMGQTLGGFEDDNFIATYQKGASSIDAILKRNNLVNKQVNVATATQDKLKCPHDYVK